ncbi:MAG: hypothetical protein M3007_03355 [Candidatus Eremiobacteraeota bacterium]|nr:hypothetical protein [Candidatus Eremiobacteraeota bacterium]
MHYLRVRYRHDVKCGEPDCGELIVLEGRTSDCVYPDGSLVKLPVEERDMRSAFELTCPAGHAIIMYAPRDLHVIKSASAGDADYPPIILRTNILE